MISMESPWKIVKCGCPSKSLAAASCDSARTTVKAAMALLVLSVPSCVTFFVFPSGPPMATMALRCLSTQAFQAATPSRSLACRSLSGRASQLARRALVLLPQNTARYALFVLMASPYRARWVSLLGEWHLELRRQVRPSDNHDESDHRKSTCDSMTDNSAARSTAAAYSTPLLPCSGVDPIRPWSSLIALIRAQRA